MSAKEQYNEWIAGDIIDEETKKELIAIADDEKEIEDRFYENLRFGTGGLRGVMGAGINRMNRYTVRKATQGLCNYLRKSGKGSGSVAISYDNRNNSREFAMETAGVLCANGINAYLYPVLHPTPMLSFAVRYLHCDAGVNITASHNTKEYNGYKVYGPDGSQVVAPMDKEIMKEVNLIGRLEDCMTISGKELLTSPYFHIIDDSVDDAFIDEVLSVRIRPDEAGKARSMKIVYSPLHGTGLMPVKRILKEAGYENVYVADGQAIQDGDFPTLRKPNPEEPEAFELAEKLAEKVGAELIILTDPDADRTGIRALDKRTGRYMHFTGNMMGALLTEYVLSSRAGLGKLPENPVVVSTVVITDMVRKICGRFGVDCDAKGLIGFKNIAKKIRAYEDEHSLNYVFGLEDSDGCLPGTYARDKDSVGTVLLLAEAAAFYHNRGITLAEKMEKLYEEYGYYEERVKSKKLSGIDGQKEIERIIRKLRENPIYEIAGRKVLSITDYKTDTMTDMISGEETKAGVDPSNMIYYRLEDNGWFLIRPSGTEPTIKYYVGVKGDTPSDSAKKADKLLDALLALN